MIGHGVDPEAFQAAQCAIGPLPFKKNAEGEQKFAENYLLAEEKTTVDANKVIIVQNHTWLPPPLGADVTAAFRTCFEQERGLAELLLHVLAHVQEMLTRLVIFIAKYKSHLRA